MTSLSRIAHASPVPAQITLGSDGATASAPIAATGMLSDTGFQWMPPSVITGATPARNFARYVRIIFCQVAFGAVCGFVVFKSAKVETQQSWSLAERLGVEAQHETEDKA